MRTKDKLISVWRGLGCPENCLITSEHIQLYLKMFRQFSASLKAWSDLVQNSANDYQHSQEAERFYTDSDYC